jgi:TrmH family RNA methyltransferase
MKYRKLESLRNPTVREAIKVKEERSLYKGATAPGERAFLIEGPHLLEMALGAGAGIGKVFYTEKFKDKDLLGRLAQKGAAVFEITERILLRLSDTETPQGIVAVTSCAPSSLDEIKIGGFIAVCDGVQDPGNLGTIIRTADASGAGAVVLLPGTCDAFMPKTLRASAGSVFNIPIVYEEREALIGKLKGMKMKLAVTLPDAKKSIYEADLSVPVAFVFGNETAGVSPELREASELRLRIPIRGRAESLNVAAASAVCLYEAMRQRNY